MRDRWQHSHQFHTRNLGAECKTRLAVNLVCAWLLTTTSITDLHVWRVGKDQYACILGLATQGVLSADSVRQALGVHEELAHITVEVNRLA
ncbi:hypothetical protein D3C77_744370 [compost metagenome]